MRGSKKGDEPPELRDWTTEQRRNGIEPQYRDLQQPERGTTEQSLFSEQTGQCVYCGRGISLDRKQHYHIEHFRPRSGYPELQLDYANLFLSCGPESELGARNTCGHHKGGLVRGGLPYPARARSLHGTFPIPLNRPHCRRRFAGG